MPIPQIKITMRKDGREVASFRDTQGRVRTSSAPVNWTRADQIRQLANYAILLQLEQASKGLGSDGHAMPPLKTRGAARFAGRRNGIAHFIRKRLRNLYGPGIDGHMLDDVRVNYLDDRRATFAITRRSSRIKALANEQKAPWWGWSPESLRKLQARAAEIFGTGVAEHLFSMGLIGANAVARGNRGTYFRRVS